MKVAERYAQHLDASLAIVHKRRVKGKKNQTEAKTIVGTVKNKQCVMIDDMIDTAGTITQGAELLMDKGAKSVIGAATHGLLSGPAVDRLKNSQFEKVFICDTLPIPPEKQFDKLEILPTAPLLADAIRAVFQDTSVSHIFDGLNQS